MTQTTGLPETGQAVYSLEGTMLKACSCGVVCPCWVGDDPEGGDCFGFIAYRFDRGEIDGVDVDGLTLVVVAQIRGNVLQGNWRVVVFVDNRANDQQKDAIMRAFTGELGGPLADLAPLIGEVEGLYSAPISHELVDGEGMLRVGTVIEADFEPYRGPDGIMTTLRETVFATAPGSPAYLAKATKNKVNMLEHGMVWSYENRSAIQAEWKTEHVA